MTPWRLVALFATCSLLLGVLGACGYGGGGGSGGDSGGGYGGGYGGDRSSAAPAASQKEYPKASASSSTEGYGY